MRFSSKRVLAVASVTTLLSGVGVAAFAVDDTKEIRQVDFIPALAAGDGEVDDRDLGHYEFLEEGLHIWTESNDSESKIAQYFAPRGGDELPTSGSQDWYGTTPAPGMQIVFDYDGTDGNGNDYNILVGETVYNGDWWLTNGSSAAAKAADPSGAENGGSGSDYFGTLQEWKDAMPDARVYAYGFSLGSGVKGDGVIRAQTFGGEEYIFTDEENPTPAPVQTTEDVTAYGYWNNANRIARFTMKSADQPADDTGRGTKVRWTIYVNNTLRYASVNGWGDVTAWQWTFSTAGGDQKVEVKRNNVSYSKRYITTK